MLLERKGAMNMAALRNPITCSTWLLLTATAASTSAHSSSILSQS